MLSAGLGLSTYRLLEFITRFCRFSLTHKKIYETRYGQRNYFWYCRPSIIVHLAFSQNVFLLKKNKTIYYYVFL